MALTKALEEMLALITDEKDRETQRGLLEKHEVLRERNEGYLRQSDYDRQLNAHKVELEAGREAVKNIGTWQKWYNDNKDIPAGLNAKIAEVSALHTQAEEEAKKLREQLATRGEEVDQAQVNAIIEQRIAKLPGTPTVEDMRKIVTEEMTKAVEAERKAFFDQTVPAVTLMTAHVTQAQLKHFKEHGAYLSDEDFTKISGIMKDQSISDPLKAYEIFAAPLNKAKETEALRVQITKEVQDKVAKEAAEKGGVPGSGATPPATKGPLEIFIGATSKAAGELPPNAGMREAAMAGAAELRAEGKG